MLYIAYLFVNYNIVLSYFLINPHLFINLFIYLFQYHQRNTSCISIIVGVNVLGLSDFDSGNVVKCKLIIIILLY